MINLFDASPFYKQHWEPHLRARLTALTLDHLSEVSNNDLTSILDWQVTEFTLQEGQLQRLERTQPAMVLKGDPKPFIPESDPISIDEYLKAIVSYRTQIAAADTRPVMFSLGECRALCTFLHIQGFKVDWEPGDDPFEAEFDYPLRKTWVEFRDCNRIYHYYKDGKIAKKNEYRVAGLRHRSYNLEVETKDIEWFAWCDVDGWLEGSTAGDSDEGEEDDGKEDDGSEGEEGDDDTDDQSDEGSLKKMALPTRQLLPGEKVDVLPLGPWYTEFKKSWRSRVERELLNLSGF